MKNKKRNTQKQEPTPVLRTCDCWLKAGKCYCLPSMKHSRYSLKNKHNGFLYGRFDTVREAMQYGNKKMINFVIYCNVEKKDIYESKHDK